MIQRSPPRPALDTLRYDRSGNQIRRSSGFGSATVTEMLYPALSNRLDTRRYSVVESPGHDEVTYD